MFFPTLYLNNIPILFWFWDYLLLVGFVHLSTHQEKNLHLLRSFCFLCPWLSDTIPSLKVRNCAAHDDKEEGVSLCGGVGGPAHLRTEDGGPLVRQDQLTSVARLVRRPDKRQGTWNISFKFNPSHHKSPCYGINLFVFYFWELLLISQARKKLGLWQWRGFCIYSLSEDW